MYAVIQTGGKQYRVSPGELIKIEKVSGAVGDDVHFDEVLFVGGDAASTLRPAMDGVTVRGTIVDQIRADKIIVFKFKRRKMYRRKTGHRQSLTSIRIEEIGPANRAEEAPKAASTPAKSKPAAVKKASPPETRSEEKSAKTKPAAAKVTPAKAEAAPAKAKPAAVKKASKPKAAPEKTAAGPAKKKTETKKPAGEASSKESTQDKE